ncbi:MAG: TQO small subunit DoxD, partial [Chloroflexota bacterium]
MSRRERGTRRVQNRPTGGVDQRPRTADPQTESSGTSLREQVERAGPAARALLAIRAFFGITFLYAGIDKLIDPAFFDAGNPGSIAGQLHAFTKVSPLAPLIGVLEPFAVPMGLLIAIAEIAIGVGALTGLAYRLAAFGGMALSFTFFFTASWTTRPYYYGADLPYAFGWMALMIAGHADLLVPSFIREIGVRAAAPVIGGYSVRYGTRPRGWLEEDDLDWPGRRTVLQAGVLAVVAVALGSLAVPVRLLRGSDASQT